jgi:hypothetical protein
LETRPRREDSTRRFEQMEWNEDSARRVRKLNHSVDQGVGVLD